MALPLKEALTRTLIEKGLLTEPKLNEALQRQRQKGGDLKDILIDLGFVCTEDIISVLSQELGIPPINLSRCKIDSEVIKIIPKAIAQHYHIIPVSKVEYVLTVAMEDPLNIFALDHIKLSTHFKIIPVLASGKDIKDAIIEYYQEATYEEIEKVASRMSGAYVEVMDAPQQEPLDTKMILAYISEAPVVKLVNQLLNEAVKMRSSDILVEPFESETRIRYRIDGVLRPIQAFPKNLHNAVVSRLKVMSSLDISEQRLPQDGRFKAMISGAEIDFRVSVLPSVLGEKVALRVLDKSAIMVDIDMLGFNSSALASLRASVKRPHGMILICGPTGSGKTTTLYSLLNIASTGEENVVTVEDPIEYQFKGFNQVSARPDMGLTFASALRAILRQDPDIIMIGEIRDYETADISIKSALTGHLLLTTLHTTTATGAIVRLINMGVEPFLISSSLILTAAQRLVRKICPDCKEGYSLQDAAREAAGIARKGPLTLYRGKGCGHCLNTGYKGRVGIMEALVATPVIRQLIADRADEYKLRDMAIRGGMVTLRDDGIQKALAGITTIEEVMRVTMGEQDLDIKGT